MGIETKIKKGFTLTEAILVIVILGVIAALAFPAIIHLRPHNQGWTNISIKMAEHLNQATIQMITFNSSLGSFKYMHKDKKSFSIEDQDAGDKIVNLYQDYISDIDLKVNMNLKYFSNEIIDYNKQPTGIILKDKYSHFMHVADGVLLGFAFHGDCTTTENYATPPETTQSYAINNVCASIFYDVNSYQKPNKLGSDQYILPLSEKGIVYDNY